MKLAKRITDRTAELAVAIRRNPPNLSDLYAAAHTHIHRLRYDAHLAFLDGKQARARALDREAFAMARHVPVEYR